ncbi:glycosyl hydrolase family 18 protein [Microbispora bryophytorum]|uniref:glycosyl hydrolase family 18 protein n=1 Tax=Microbispora bryophytorum TaxID=1460882 RepID=UPI0036CF0138
MSPTPTSSHSRATSTNSRGSKPAIPGLKVLISLGGWTGSQYFSDAVLTSQSRAKLAASCVDLGPRPARRADRLSARRPPAAARRQDRRRRE